MLAGGVAERRPLAAAVESTRSAAAAMAGRTGASSFSFKVDGMAPLLAVAEAAAKAAERLLLLLRLLLLCSLAL